MTDIVTGNTISYYLLYGNMIQPKSTMTGTSQFEQTDLKQSIVFVPSLMGIFNYIIDCAKNKNSYKFYRYVSDLFAIDTLSKQMGGIIVYDSEFEHFHCIFEGLKRKMLFNKYKENILSIKFATQTIECIQMIQIVHYIQMKR